MSGICGPPPGIDCEYGDSNCVAVRMNSQSNCLKRDTGQDIDDCFAAVCYAVGIKRKLTDDKPDRQE